MGRISEKVIALLLLLFLIVYVGYQIYRYYYVPLQTETIYAYTVSHSIDTKGIAVRNEVVISQSASSTDRNVYQDGERVSVGQPVMERYGASTGDRQVQRIRQIEQEIEALTEAQNPAISNYSNAESLNRDIRENMGYMAQMSGTGRFSDMDTVAPNIISLINKRQVAVGKEDNYQERITRLWTEYNQLSGTSSAAVSTVATAPQSGYYVRTTDGLESLTPDYLKSLTLEDVCKLIETATGESNNRQAGKIVTNSTWYFAAIVPRDEVQWVDAGKTVSLEFEAVDGEVPGVVEKVLLEQNQEEAVLLIRLNHANGDLLNLRDEQATIHIQQYSGLRISAGNVHVRKTRSGDEVQGVFVLSKSTVKFKRIEPIYEEGGYIICRETPTPQITKDPDEEDGQIVIVDSETLENEELDLTLPESYEMIALYDQVIVKGRDLYHGKVVE